MLHFHLSTPHILPSIALSLNGSHRFHESNRRIVYHQYSVPTILQAVTRIVFLKKAILLSFCIRLAALGNLKASFHRARLHYLLG